MRKFCYITLSKKTVIATLLAVVVLAAAVFTATGWDKTLTATTQGKKLPIYRTYQTEKKVALSFDAAWGDICKVQNPRNPHK